MGNFALWAFRLSRKAFCDQVKLFEDFDCSYSIYVFSALLELDTAWRFSSVDPEKKEKTCAVACVTKENSGVAVS